MQFKSLALFAAIAGFVAAASTPEADITPEVAGPLIEAAIARQGGTVETPGIEKRCAYENWSVCVAVESAACSWACQGNIKCLPNCPQIAYKNCKVYGCNGYGVQRTICPMDGCDMDKEITGYWWKEELGSFEGLQ